MNFKINPFSAILLFIFILLVYFYYFGISSNISQTNQAEISSKSILSVCIDLAERAGVSIKSFRNEPFLNEIVKGKTKEGANELLTKADVDSHKILYNGLKKSFPGLNIISEEHVDPEDNDLYIPNKKHKSLMDFESNESFNPLDLTIWIDPLDATQEYIENLTDYVSVMICVTKKGVPVIGVIHRPFTDQTIWGYVNHGTSKFNRRMQKSNLFNVLVSRSHAGDIKKLMKEKLPHKNINILPVGGAGYKFLRVLKEEAALYVHKTAIKLWDVCAADAIARSVKYCSFTTLKGRQLKYSSGNPVINNDGIIASCTPEGDKLTNLILKE